LNQAGYRQTGSGWIGNNPYGGSQITFEHRNFMGQVDDTITLTIGRPNYLAQPIYLAVAL